MQVSHAVRERRSTRAFLSDPVDTDTIVQIIELAKWAPSWANMQDWSVYVVIGEPLERIRMGLALRSESGTQAAPDIPMPVDEIPDYLSARMNVLRPLPEATKVRPGTNIGDLYGAPCLVLLAVDPQLPATYTCFDAGTFAQTFCLAAEDRGFSTCIMAMPVRYPDMLRAEIPESAGKSFVVGIALGLCDPAAVVNRSERTRVEFDAIATIVGDTE
jgi:nitroreductase